MLYNVSIGIMASMVKWRDDDSVWDFTPNSVMNFELVVNCSKSVPFEILITHRLWGTEWKWCTLGAVSNDQQGKNCKDGRKDYFRSGQVSWTIILHRHTISTCIITTVEPLNKTCAFITNWCIVLLIQNLSVSIH